MRMYVYYISKLYIYIIYVYTYIFPNKIKIRSSMGPNLGMSIHHGIRFRPFNVFLGKFARFCKITAFVSSIIKYVCKCKQEVSSV